MPTLLDLTLRSMHFFIKLKTARAMMFKINHIWTSRIQHCIIWKPAKILSHSSVSEKLRSMEIGKFHIIISVIQ